MKYYQVKSQYDQKRKYPHTDNYDILICDELYTEEEVKELKIDKSCFNVTYASPDDIYYCFGARFNSKIARINNDFIC